MRRGLCMLATLSLIVMFAGGAWAHSGAVIEVPKLLFKPTLDGDFSEWEDFAFTDGEWEQDRIHSNPWAAGGSALLDAVNDQTNESNEPEGTALTPDDLTSSYWVAWDDDGLWAGTRVVDNVHDVRASNELPSRWPWKDACSWFIDVPHDASGEGTQQGDHIWSFIAEEEVRDGHVWWRHGEGDQFDLEVPAPDNVVHVARVGGGPYDANYEMEMFMPWDNMIALTPDFSPAEGVTIGFVVVSTDPDGTTPDGGDIQDWGGQNVVWGAGATDETYGDAVFIGPVEGQPVAVETSNWSQIKQLFR